MSHKIKPARRVQGTIAVPGDKSIGHRAALLSILAKGQIRAVNFPIGDDCLRSLQAAQAFGVKAEPSDNAVVFTPPDSGAIAPEVIIECGNSGTTARLLAGIAAGLPYRITLAGDSSLSQRPMMRIVTPLRTMGAELFPTDDHLPLTIQGAKLLPFEYRLPIPSAQVKSAILLAGLSAGCSVTVREDEISRDHTERMIQAIGEGLTVRDIKAVQEVDPNDPRKKRMVMPEPFKREILLSNRAQVTGGEVNIPGDISTATFFFAAAAITQGTVTVTNVGLNPTRTAILDHLRAIGCTVTIENRTVVSEEPRGDVTVAGGPLKARKLHGDMILGLIDELPIVAVMAAYAEGTTIIRDAAELRVKESDRLKAIAENLGKMGVKCGLLEDGLAIEGKAEPAGADFESFGDHRIAMAFAVAALGADGHSTIDQPEAVAISCPLFFDLLEKVRG